MRLLFTILATGLDLFSFIIFVRIILTWFSGPYMSGPALFLSSITDPYLFWFRRFRFLQVGYLDLSPIAGITLLSLLSGAFHHIAYLGRISVGVILALLLSALWSALSFLLGFCILILALRLFAYLSSRNIYSSFWRVIDTISRPLLYRIQTILFRDRRVRYTTSIISSLAVLGLLWLGGRLVLYPLALKFFLALPF
jgi:YggT family protein